ncbi:DUF4402 domain-containing protein [Cetobacterium sp. 8H]|uniref:DUF4402 domain-containing protein n=1 Tax=Cetobacterium sp. 8H TaxID=2759681 RepID=UPI00163BE2D3|nr:DUF4402 domain-containing protein [Cetobacterium sp. 8H]MBC2850818.1 DUF4402 domain-containing protein [Cetobacterium sp. 8H]
MKKLITLLSLTMAMTAFGAPQGNTEKTGDMKITATVITPLTVVAQPMQFNKIIKGTTTPVTATATANFSITGEQGETVTVTIPNTVTLINKANNQNQLAVAISGTTGEPTAMNLETSTISIPVTGTITTNSSTATGEYEGNLTARVTYN